MRRSDPYLKHTETCPFGNGMRLVSKTLCTSRSHYENILAVRLQELDPFVCSSNGEVRKFATHVSRFP